MAHISRSALVPYSPEQMYRLVDDVPLYPQFLPWCRMAHEYERDGDQVKASIEIAKGAVNKRFTTLNRLQKNKTIEMRLVDGPFKHLHGFWRFDELQPGACKVSLDLDFEFSSKILSLAVGPVFNQVANTLVDSFVERARKVYGKS
ncbi:MAG: type II toxin-antitoxin system RatA family toxin [Gammaproteobacteria bacterium]|nr:type II toxin-antitoxin system RatA family toxin [Gammaproteobacteria bacterium]MBU1724446.1 type II toxin-antitoxin system RatA family toxin [Gammaproteobacteria bacterium]MBU2004168.1 type II toxin-antitoxin system RatA family toxin [Gammaproteobacteria bacterium]